MAYTGKLRQKGIFFSFFFFFQASGIIWYWVGISVMSWSIWKGWEICHFGLQNDLKGLQKDLVAVKKSRKFSGLVFYPYLKDSDSTVVKGMQSFKLYVSKGVPFVNGRYTKGVYTLFSVKNGM